MRCHDENVTSPPPRVDYIASPLATRPPMLIDPEVESDALQGKRMEVLNVHERRFATPPSAVGRLLDGLASADDRLWPHDRWPPMRFDRPLEVGAAGGHGPVRYTVETYEPGRRVVFRFTGPPGFLGTHRYDVEALADGGTRLRHTLAMRAAGTARLTWPLVFRPLHDALIEDSLDRAAVALGEAPVGARWSRAVQTLRGQLARIPGVRRGAGPPPSRQPPEP